MTPQPYSLYKLQLDQYGENSSSDSSKENTCKDFGSWLKNYTEMVKPDFVCVFDLKQSPALIYSKNYALKFERGRKETIEEIENSLEPNQVKKVIEADKRITKFRKDNFLQSAQCVFQLRFTASLIKGVPRSYIRNSFSINNSGESSPYTLVISINDISNLHSNIQAQPFYNIRWQKGVDLKFDKKVNNLQKELNNIVAPEIKFTRREREIVTLISRGRTSKRIAEELCISKATVNTHRQNLIHKFNVKNIFSIVNLL